MNKKLRKKPQNTAVKIRLLGYETDNIYRVLNSLTKGIYCRQDVRFPNRSSPSEPLDSDDEDICIKNVESNDISNFKSDVVVEKGYTLRKVSTSEHVLERDTIVNRIIPVLASVFCNSVILYVL